MGVAAETVVGVAACGDGAQVTSLGLLWKLFEACTREGAGRGPNFVGPREDGVAGRSNGAFHVLSRAE